MNDRDRLAADLKDADETVTGNNDWYGKIADHLIALGWTRMDEPLALIYGDHDETPAYVAVARHCDETFDRSGALLGRVRARAAAIAKAYREDTDAHD